MESNTPQPGTLAVETHNGRIWSLIILFSMIIPASSLALAPPPPVKFALIMVAAVGIFASAMAWSGFQYRFQRHGLEIRLLSFRLRFIPRSAIVSYRIEPWAFVRGYGIRGIGSTRAYVWCNKVVHIKTTNGDVYLGHNNPARIVRDLDQMMGLVTGG